MKFKHHAASICFCLAFLAIIPFASAMQFVESSGGGEQMEFKLRPEANISYYPKSGPAPLYVVFQNRSRFEEKIEWDWWLAPCVDYSAIGVDIDADTVSSKVIPYLHPGTYPVYLHAENAIGTDVDVVFVTVTEPMPFTVDFVGSPRQSNSPESEVSFIASVPYTSQILFSYLWDFGDGSGSTDPNPTHKYEAEGAYTVTLTVTDCTGWYADTVIKQDYITIGSVGVPEVVVSFYGAPTSTFVGQNVYFYNNTQASYDSSLWDFGDGTGSSEQHPIHAYQSSGVYSVTLQVLGSFGEVTKTKNNYIQVLPAVSSDEIKPVFKANPVNGISPHVVQFNNLTGGAFQDMWWDFGDGATSTDINPLHTYEQPGNYTVTLFVGDNAATKLDYIYTLPPEGAYQTPASLLLSGDPEALQMLGAFRDSIMAQGIYGTGLLELYYKHALELVAILQEDTALFGEVQGLLALCLPQFEASLSTGTFDIPVELRPAILAALGKMADQASPDLSEAIIKLMRDWDSNEFFQSINCSAQTSG